MTETKPFASLSSGLLARKGMAKPAMRPQGFGQFGGIEDLGWNDMGHGRPAPMLTPEPAAEPQPAPVVALMSAPVTAESEPVATGPEPAVVDQQRDLATHFDETETPSVIEAKPARKRQATAVEPQKASVPRTRVLPGAKGKAAFTLRLDPDRHLRLRLASALTRRSSQMLVTDALDSYLDSLPELDTVSVSAKAH